MDKKRFRSESLRLPVKIHSSMPASSSSFYEGLTSMPMALEPPKKELTPQMERWKEEWEEAGGEK